MPFSSDTILGMMHGWYKEPIPKRASFKVPSLTFHTTSVGTLSTHAENYLILSQGFHFFLFLFFLFHAQGFRVGRTNETIKQASQNLQYCLVLWLRTRTIERCRWELQRSKIPCFFQQKFRFRPTLVQDLGMSQQCPTSSDISCSLGYKIG